MKSALGVGQLALQYGAIWKCENLKKYFGRKSEYLPTSKGTGSDVPNIGISVENIYWDSDLFLCSERIFRPIYKGFRFRDSETGLRSAKSSSTYLF